MAPKSVPKAKAAAAPAPKVTKAQQKALDEEAAQKAKDKKGAQANMITQCANPKATVEQKAILEAYRAAPRFSEKKQELLELWQKDKTCKWYSSYTSTASKGTESSVEAAQGYGTVFSPPIFFM